MPMTGRILTALSLIALALGPAACGGDGGSTTATETTTTFDTDTTVTTTTTEPETTKLRVYFLLNDDVQPVARNVPRTEAVAAEALDQLLAGPSTSEQELGLVSALPAGVQVERVTVEGGQAHVRVSEHLDSDAMAQLVYTVTQFPTVTRGVEVEMPDATLVVDRADYEDMTPAILVESPLPFETVSNPIHATGTANTFEANFQYEVVDPSGKVVDTHFVTATSGTGTRGTFEFTTKPYTGEAGQGALVVLEFSAKDGSRTKEVRIPIQLEP
jgi:Immunoglobulin-like domain of bacterial spore germination/Sporulation and spore germination